MKSKNKIHFLIKLNTIQIYYSKKRSNIITENRGRPDQEELDQEFTEKVSLKGDHPIS